MPKDLQAVAGRDLRRLKRELHTWKAVAAALNGKRPAGLKPINVGLIYNVAVKGKRAPNSILTALGYETRTAPAPVCQTCGVVHLARSCPRQRRQRPPAALSDWPTRALARAIRERTEYTGDHR